MKIRTDEQLLDFLAQNKQRRKRELVSFKQDLRNDIEVKRVEMSAVVFGYAHWEGFVKQAARAYVQFVSNKSRAFVALSSNFQALFCRQELRIAQNSSKKITPHLNLIDLLLNKNINSVSIDENAIDTESNLNSEIFENICISIGINYKIMWSHEAPFINDLFGNRCAIAHGELFDPPKNYATEVIDRVIFWIDCFSTDVENAAIEKAYLKK
ncbi:hypothetical protein KTR66_18220 [Roseococcus sp. SDR]|uniref:MAE_28990/MAE_18760 family HEPN-like nuclease n=1 Tax=Roseococcus sp. SDR TaxID=2835532 RepID=UPI001BD184C0|nr:hypothetical protein [Roseococcus sp. SDR]MBV1847255.1 hypothetical protein [Roseococcus sp. SDR]